MVRSPGGPTVLQVEAEILAGPVVAYKVDGRVIRREPLAKHLACPTCGTTLESRGGGVPAE